jgi:hypothetical protein
VRELCDQLKIGVLNNFKSRHEKRLALVGRSVKWACPTRPNINRMAIMATMCIMYKQDIMGINNQCRRRTDTLYLQGDGPAVCGLFSYLSRQKRQNLCSDSAGREV